MLQASFKSRVIGASQLNWRKFELIQNEEPRELSQLDMQKLKVSMLKDKFAQPVCVWQDPVSKIVYSLDGYYRIKAMEELAQSGEKLPVLIPAIFIHCANKQEATKLLSLYLSHHMSLAGIGLLEFIEEYVPIVSLTNTENLNPEKQTLTGMAL